MLVKKEETSRTHEVRDPLGCRDITLEQYAVEASIPIAGRSQGGN